MEKNAILSRIMAGCRFDLKVATGLGWRYACGLFRMETPVPSASPPSVLTPVGGGANRRRFVFMGVAALLLGLLILVRMEHAWEGATLKRSSNGLDAMIGIDFGRIYGFWAGVGNVLLLSLILISSRWWWPRVNADLPIDFSFKKPGNPERAEKFLLIALVLLSVWIRLPQLDRWVFRDEQDTLRYQIHGYHQLDKKTQQLEFSEATWADAFFWNPHGNNPVLTSVTSKASLDLWRSISGAPRDTFNRIAFRLPVFLAGLLTIVALWWMARAVLAPELALGVAAMGALHPEIINYGIEARGYGFMLLGGSVSIGAAFLALRHGTWRNWGLLGFGFFIMLFAYAGSVFFVLPFALIIFGTLLGRRRQSELKAAADRDLLRLILVGAAFGGIFVQVEMPALMCFLLQQRPFPWTNDLDAGWLFSFWTQNATGRMFEWDGATPGSPSLISHVLGTLFPQAPLYWTLAISIPVFMVVGLVSFWRANPPWARLLMIVALISPLIQAVVHFYVIHRVLFFFYLLYVLPVYLVLLLEGLSRGGQLLTVPKVMHPASSKVPGAVITGFLLLYFITCTSPKPALQRSDFLVQTEPEIYTRGKSNWIVYPTGQILSQRTELPVPATFAEAQKTSPAPTPP